MLIDNFNNLSNLQGTGTTIVDYSPSAHKTFTFAKLPQNLPQCPGGVGLTTAMTMLKSGWVIVGSTPSTDGTTATKGPGCLIVFDSNGQLATVWTGPNINDPWGNMAVIDRGSTATLFVSMAGFDMPAPSVRDPATGFPITVNKSTVLRIDLNIPAGGAPASAAQTVIASGLSAHAPIAMSSSSARPASRWRRTARRSTSRTPSTTRSSRSPTRRRGATAPVRAGW